MKSRLLVWTALVVVFLIVFSGCAVSTDPEAADHPIVQDPETGLDTETDEKPIESKKTDQSETVDIAGIWINTDYDGQGRSAMVVFEKCSDDSYNYTAYDNSDESGDVYQGTVQYTRIWKDEQGRRLGHSLVNLENGMSWETLDRISADGLTLEVQSDVEEINPDGPRYSIYYRK